MNDEELIELEEETSSRNMTLSQIISRTNATQQSAAQVRTKSKEAPAPPADAKRAMMDEGATFKLKS